MRIVRNALEAGGRRTVIAAAMVIGLAHPASSGDITFAAGSPGGGYFQAAAAFAEYLKAEIPNTSTTVMPGGGWANVERIAPEAKQADVAVVENVLSTLAWRGETPTKKKYDFRMLAAVRGPSIAQAVIVKSVGIRSFDEIREKKYPIRIATFERNQLVTPVALDILAEYGLSEAKIRSFGGKIIYTSQDEGIRMINDGHADMWLTGGSFYPHNKYIQLGSKAPFLLLPISKEIASKVAAKYGAEIMEVPGGIYKDANGENVPYWSPMMIIGFAVRKDLADDLVYKMTDILARNKEKFWQVHPQHKFYKPEEAWKNVGLAPLHPGAEKWYKEKGYMK